MGAPIRIKVDNPSPTPDDFYYWDGVWNISSTPSGIGPIMAILGIGIVTLTPTEFADLQTYVNDRVTGILEDIASAVNA